MALEFPANPSDGDIYDAFTWSAAVGAWRASDLPQQVVVASATPPSNPQVGALWFNTNDGSNYVYFNDGTGTQWVQVKSDATLSSTLGNRVTTLEASPSGLVPIVPSSVSVTSGTASIASDGTITFSGASGIGIDGIFSSTFRNYRAMTDVTSVNNAIYLWQGRVGGVSTTSANYYYNELYASAGTVGASGGGPSAGVTNGRTAYMEAGTFTSVSMDIYSPQIASHTQTFSVHGRLSSSGSPVLVTNTGGCQLTTQFTGINFSASAGTFGGTIKFYGYR